MENKTTEFSFILKAAKYGVGVFATHDIKKGTYLRLFNEENVEVSRLRNKKDVPEVFQEYCVDRGDMLLCPSDFGHMEVGWYLNHSKDPNAYHKDYNYYALRDIKEGEEIIIDYNTLEEPEESKKEYYSK
jgi:hypothetical protein